jgi:glutaredoxin-like YruB-family protein
VTTVNIYTTSTCSQCAKTRAWLSANGVDYNEFNIVEDPEALQRMIEISGSRNVPVIQIGERVIVGFKEDEIAAYLAEK